MLKRPPPSESITEWSLPARLGRLGMGHLVAVLVAATVVILVMAALAVLQGVAEADREDHQRALGNHAQALAEAVDLEFEMAETTLGALSESDALARGDLVAFEGELRRVSQRLGGVAMALAGPDGQVQLTTFLGPGDAGRAPVSLPAVQAMASGATQISDVFRGRYSGRPVTVIAVPVRGPDGAPAQRALIMALRPERYAALIAERRLPDIAGLEVGIADRTGTVIARTEPGGSAAAVADGAAAPAGEVDGRQQIRARAETSGYQVTVSVPSETPRASLLRARWRTVGLGVAVMALSLGVAMLLARRLRGELRRIAAADAAPVAGVAPRTGLREVDVLATTLARTRRERDRATAELRALFEVSPIGMARADLGGRVQEANAAFLALVGLGERELTAGEVRWDELTPPELLPRDEHAIAEAVKTGRCTPYEKSFQRADGTRVPVLVSLALLDRSSGECAVFAVDLSALKRTEAALADSEARLERALAAAEMASWDWDMENGVVVGSPGREALYGRQPGTMRDGAAMLAAIHPDDRAAMRMAMERALDPDADGTYEHEFRALWPNGTLRWLHSRGCATRRDPLGRVLHMSGVVRDISALREAQERRELLVREVDHRAKNVLAVVQAVLKLTRAEDPRQYARTVEGRIAALAKAHALLSRQRWAGADLRALVAEELAAFGGAEDPAQGGTDRVTLDGPAVFLSPWTVQPLSMALHELATNAAKYGALATPDGQLAVRWELLGDGGGLRVDWIERGAAAIAAPDRKGFGTRVIDGAIGDQLGGQVQRSWQPDGLSCRIVLPAERVAGETGPRPLATPLPPSRFADLSAWGGRRVLVVEDDALIAHSLVEALTELGIDVVGPVGTLEQALGIAATAHALDAAVLDINLGGRLAVPVADVLAGRGVPMVFASGYGSLPRDSLPERHRATPLLMKPVRAEVIVATLSRHASRVVPAAA